MAALLPEDFRCPISLEIMSDPVILSSGHTFDRSSIQRWLDSGHRTCPITKLPLADHPSLIPNHALRSLISSYTRNLSLPPEPVSSPDPEPQALMICLTSRKSSIADKLDSLTLLNRLLKSNPIYRRRIAELGEVSAVLRCVDVPSLQEKALNILLDLSLDDDIKVGLVAEGAIGRIIGLLKRGGSPPGCQAVGATILTSLAVLQVNKATIGAYPGAIKALVSLIRDGKGRERKEAVTALYAVCSFLENRRRAVSCGAVPILIRMAKLGLERAVEVLGLLVRCKEGREEMVKFKGAVPVLVGILNNGSSRGVQCALSILNSLCFCSERICNEARNDGVLELCSRFLEVDNEKIRLNAASLFQVVKEN